MKRILPVVLAVAALLAASLAACSKTETVASPSPGGETVAVSAAESPSAGESVSPSASPLPKLPLEQARVEGRFLGAGFFGRDLTFSAICASGPCNAVGEDNEIKVKFKRHGASYEGTVTDHQDCGPSHGLHANIAVHYAYSFKVTKAEYIKGEWRATAIDTDASMESPGGTASASGSGWSRTLTCKPFHRTGRGNSFLKGH